MSQKPQPIRLAIPNADVRPQERAVILTLQHPILVAESFEAALPFHLVKQMAGMILTGEGNQEQKRAAAATAPKIVGVER